MRVATFLSVIGEDAAKVYDIFTWLAGENEQCIDQVSKFDSYCEPRTHIIYGRFRFNNRIQEAGESISAYVNFCVCQSPIRDRLVCINACCV